MSNTESSDEKLYYKLTFSTDRDHFFRRTCPSCGRDFKTEVDEASRTSPLTSRIRRIERAAIQPEEDGDNLVYCPYCLHCAKINDMITEETSNYFKRHMMREYGLPQINKLITTAGKVPGT